MAAIKVIPASENKPKTLRVAAYCRVSSDSSDQLHSYAAQIRNYTEVIRKHDDWELVDVYADEGLTGTRMDTRDDFNRMLADCRKGKIDRILVKSISRFARNTRDCLVVLRELSGLGVSVYFEKENIGTETLTTEFMVSVYGALAQEESVSISQNQRMSYRRRMEKGEFITNCAPLGYRIDGKKNLAVVEEEAEIVRWIYESYLSGRSTEWIADEVIRRGAPTATGTGAWREESVHRILTNEKYIGDALCQKQYTPDSFPFVRKVNRGDVDQYYIEQTHPAIIPKETFERVQTLRKKRTQSSQNHCSDSPLAHKIICANCGSSFRRRVSKKGYAVWVCAKHDHHAAECPIGRVSEQEIHAAFVSALPNFLFTSREIRAIIRKSVERRGGGRRAREYGNYRRSDWRSHERSWRGDCGNLQRQGEHCHAGRKENQAEEEIPAASDSRNRRLADDWTCPDGDRRHSGT